MKSVFLLGYGRSGTTLLSLVIKKIFGNILYEPLNPFLLSRLQSLKKQGEILLKVHPYWKKSIHKKLYEDYLKYFDFNILRKHILFYHPNLDGKYRIIYNTPLLKKYLKPFIKYNVKDGAPFLYVSLLKKYWNVYYIIRHPIDTFASILNRSDTSFLKNQLLLNSRLFRINYKLHLYDPFYVIEMFKEQKQVFDIQQQPSNFFETFIVTWINYYCYLLDELKESKMLIYGKINTYKKLGDDVSSAIKDIKYRYYPHMRKKFEKKVFKVAEKFGLLNELKMLLSFVR